MNIDEMKLGDLKQIAAMFNTPQKEEVKPHRYTGKKVLLRSYASGVHIGTLDEYDAVNKSAFLKDSQRIHQWSGAFTLSKVATVGITGGRISCKLDEIFIERVEELILISDDALKSIENLGIHNE
jgi:hypothetical protein